MSDIIAPIDSGNAEPIVESAIEKPDAKVESKPAETTEIKSFNEQNKLKGNAKLTKILGNKAKETPANDTEIKDSDKKPEGVNNPLESKKEAESPSGNQEPKKKQTARERIKDLTDQRNDALATSEAYLKERDQAISMLEYLQRKQNAGHQLTSKEQIQEVLAEQRVNELNYQRTNDLESKIDTMDDPDGYRTNYEYYVPIIERAAPQLSKMLVKLDNYPEVLGVMFNAINEGQIDLRQWIAKPLPVQMNEIKFVSQKLKEKSIPRNAGGSLASAANSDAKSMPKQMVKSITPDLKKEQSSTAKPDRDVVEARLDKYRLMKQARAGQR